MRCASFLCVLPPLSTVLSASQERAPGSTPPDPVGERATPALFSWGDFDGDGRLDLAAVSVEGALRLLSSAGEGRYEDVTEPFGLAGVESAALALWADYDADGRLDLFVGARAGASRLFHNEGGVFVDMSAGSGLESEGAVQSAQWLDHDGDGRLDLFVATAEKNELFRGLEGGFFEEVELPALSGEAGTILGGLGSDLARGSRPASDPSVASGGTAVDGPGTASSPLLAFRRPSGGSLPLGLPVGGRGVCATTIEDKADPATCLEASTTPTEGRLYPLSKHLFVSVGGDVGIGTTSPAAKLDVAGTATVTGFRMPTGASANKVLTSDGAGNASWQQPETLTSEQREILDHLSIVYLDDGLGGTVKTIQLTGANLRIVNGLGSTNTRNGLGNLIVGYNEPGNPFGDDRTGSHNIVSGQKNTFSSVGGLVVGDSNRVLGRWASVSGGSRNTASGNYSSVGGGYDNTASGRTSSVSGGQENTARGLLCSVSGGRRNTASGSYCSVSGGESNTASGPLSSVTGGVQNTASGFFSSVSGGDSGEASGQSSSVSGGAANTASGHSSSVSGGRGNVAFGRYASISGGKFNEAFGPYSSVSGGRFNITLGSLTSVSGGFYNRASGSYSSVSGGFNNGAYGHASIVSGGRGNRAFGRYASVSGGQGNEASGNYSSVSGGSDNEASASSSLVSGGRLNSARGAYSSISGGQDNEANGRSSSVSGGRYNVASGYAGSVSGGFENSAGGHAASVSGGQFDSAPGPADWAAGDLFQDN